MPRTTEVTPGPPTRTVPELIEELRAHERALENELARTRAATQALEPEPVKRGPGRPRIHA